MKTYQKRFIVVLAGFVATMSLYGQSKKPYDNPKYGADSASRMECASNLSSMSEFAKIKLYDFAYAPWKSCFENCPSASKNIYIQGKKIVEHRIKSSQSEEAKDQLIDTLMLLYDRRIENFGQEGMVLGKKAISLLKHRREAVQEAYEILKKSIEIQGNASDASVVATFMTTSGVLYNKGNIQADVIIDNYLVSVEILEHTRPGKKTDKAKEGVEKVFAESGAASCEALVNIFTPKFEADKENEVLLAKIADLLSNTECQDQELFAKVSEALYPLKPSAKAAANLAVVFSTRKDYSKAIEYYNKALELESDPEAKAKYYYQLAALALENKNYTEVRKLGYKAIGLKADYGEAYMIIGRAYAAGSKSCGSKPFENATAFLAAVDKFNKAKAVSPGLTSQATDLINSYKQYYPNKEEAFFEGYTKGQSYVIKCWINETTTIRTR